jgi:hypothetical protein
MPLLLPSNPAPNKSTLEKDAEKEKKRIARCPFHESTFWTQSYDFDSQLHG